ncbi:hypothetical protein CYMTET_50750 [Cymbomonas tetramitiformis]|uniref:Tyr recombinase domain-containing protein n=1 Tax=Cymbomonas tetramitiformis TaxID=36881 RepID=A0AAE0BP67_9CHLO|nr:hypothetical protein CYMTET_50750 [Cymbomonas tetramitiformis]
MRHVPGSPICPVTSLQRVMEGPGLGEDGPLFCIEDAKGRLKPLTHSFFVSTFRKLAERAGLDPKAYSGHSFRRGGATAASGLAVADHLIQAHGDWASDCYKLYIDLGREQQLLLPSAMAEDLPSDGVGKFLCVWPRRSGLSPGAPSSNQCLVDRLVQSKVESNLRVKRSHFEVEMWRELREEYQEKCVALDAKLRSGGMSPQDKRELRRSLDRDYEDDKKDLVQSLDQAMQVAKSRALAHEYSDLGASAQHVAHIHEGRALEAARHWSLGTTTRRFNEWRDFLRDTKQRLHGRVDSEEFPSFSMRDHSMGRPLTAAVDRWLQVLSQDSFGRWRKKVDTSKHHAAKSGELLLRYLSTQKQHVFKQWHNRFEERRWEEGLISKVSGKVQRHAMVSAFTRWNGWLDRLHVQQSKERMSETFHMSIMLATAFLQWQENASESALEGRLEARADGYYRKLRTQESFTGWRNFIKIYHAKAKLLLIGLGKWIGIGDAFGSFHCWWCSHCHGRVGIDPPHLAQMLRLEVRWVRVAEDAGGCFGLAVS